MEILTFENWASDANNSLAKIYIEKSDCVTSIGGMKLGEIVNYLNDLIISYGKDVEYSDCEGDAYVSWLVEETDDEYNKRIDSYKHWYDRYVERKQHDAKDLCKKALAKLTEDEKQALGL